MVYKFSNHYYMNIDTLNPILFGLIAGIITYIILYIDVGYENKKIKLKPSQNSDGKCRCPSLYITMKVPLIIGSLVWSAASYFDQSKQLIDESFLFSINSRRPRLCLKLF